MVTGRLLMEVMGASGQGCSGCLSSGRRELRSRGAPRPGVVVAVGHSSGQQIAFTNTAHPSTSTIHPPSLPASASTRVPLGKIDRRRHLLSSGFGADRLSIKPPARLDSRSAADAGTEHRPRVQRTHTEASLRLWGNIQAQTAADEPWPDQGTCQSPTGSTSSARLLDHCSIHHRITACLQPRQCLWRTVTMASQQANGIKKSNIESFAGYSRFEIELEVSSDFQTVIQRSSRQVNEPLMAICIAVRPIIEQPAVLAIPGRAEVFRR